MRAQMGDSPNAEMNITEFDGETCQRGGDYQRRLVHIPFLADKRLVIVRGLDRPGSRAKAPVRPVSGPSNNWSTTCRSCQSLPGSCLSSVANWPPTASCSSWPSRIRLATKKPFSAPKDSTSWILARAKEVYEVEMEPRAAHALASVTGRGLAAGR